MFNSIKNLFKNKFVLLSIILIVLTFSLIKILPEKEAGDEKTDNPLGTFITLEAKDGKVTVLMEKDRILLEPFEKIDGSSNAESFTVTEEEYPELFQRNGGVHFLSAEIENDRIKLINNVHDHFGYSPYYNLNIDLFSGQVLSQNYEY